MSNKLRDEWYKLCENYSDNFEMIGYLWMEIQKAYKHSSRHYHNFDHLNHMIKEAYKLKDQIKEWDAFLFSIFYHDIVYQATRRDNEQKSAEKSVHCLNQLGVSAHQILLIERHIIATKAHLKSKNDDTNLLLDLDLAILASSEEYYKQYCESVRKEYRIYPDLLYYPGRKKVLKHFLEMDTIFKTDIGIKRFESKARLNIEQELRLLS